MSTEFEMGEATHIAMLASDAEDENERNAFLMDPQNFSTFYDGLVEVLATKHKDIDSDEERVKYLTAVSDEKSLGLSSKNISNWINANKKGTRSDPQANNTSRDNIYKLCFALELNYEETKEFFSKVYLSRPFDGRNVDEAIYVYCFRHNKSYDDFKRIKKEIVLNEGKHSDGFVDNTAAFITRIEEIEDERELINFINNNSYFFGKRNQTALYEFNRLLSQAKVVDNTSSNSELFKKMTAIDFRKRGKNGRPTFKNSSFLKMVRLNFPSEEVFSKLQQSDEKATYDAIRKSLILLKFYIYASDEDNFGMFDDFKDETNDLLNECGYHPLYYRNPYDWIFLHCFKMEDPLDEFQSILEDMLYLD